MPPRCGNSSVDNDQSYPTGRRTTRREFVQQLWRTIRCNCILPQLPRRHFHLSFIRLNHVCRYSYSTIRLSYSTLLTRHARAAPWRWWDVVLCNCSVAEMPFCCCSCVTAFAVVTVRLPQRAPCYPSAITSRWHVRTNTNCRSRVATKYIRCNNRPYQDRSRPVRLHDSNGVP